MSALTAFDDILFSLRELKRRNKHIQKAYIPENLSEEETKQFEEVFTNIPFFKYYSLSDFSNKNKDSEAVIYIKDPHVLTHPDFVKIFTDFLNVTVLVPREVLKEHKSIFLVTIPKSGTHLILNVLEALGYTSGVGMSDIDNNKHWYPITSSNTHTRATKFFTNYPEDEIHGGRLHKFGKIPTVFLIRNPLDILLSEAEYYPQSSQTIFATYFDGMTKEQTLIELITSELIGRFEYRMKSFAPWIKFPSVIPIFFESLISLEFGGSDLVLEKTIWNLGLKLQIECNTKDVINNLSKMRSKSETFNRGRIGRYKEHFTETVHRALAETNTNYLSDFGYAHLWSDDFNEFSTIGASNNFISSIYQDYLTKPVQLITDIGPEPPVLVSSKSGFNIVRFNEIYFVLSQGKNVDFFELYNSAYPFKSKDIAKIEYMLNAYTDLIRSWPY